MLVGVVVNIGLNVVLIPEYSYIGSGWATVLTEVLVLTVLTLGVLRIPGVRPLPWVAIAKCSLAATCAGLAGWALLDRIPWPVAGLVTAIVYLAVVHFVNIDGPGGLRVLAGEPRDDLAAEES